MIDAVHILEEYNAEIAGSMPKLIFSLLRQMTPTIHDGLVKLCQKYPVDHVAVRKMLFSDHYWKDTDFIAEDCDVLKRAVHFLRAIGVDINTRGHHGETLLHAACQQRRATTIPCLIDVGIDVNATDRFGATALHLATKDMECFKMLVDHPDIEHNIADRFGSTPWHWTILRGTREMVYLLGNVSDSLGLLDGSGKRRSDLLLASHWVRVMLQQLTQGEYTDRGRLRNIGSEPASILGRCDMLNPQVLNPESVSSWALHITDHRDDIQRFIDRVITSPNMGLLLDIPDNKAIIDSVMSILESVADDVGREDPRLASSVVLTGSNREGTKVITMDEIDAMFRLEAFKGKFEPEREEEMSHRCGELKATLRLKDTEYSTPQDYISTNHCLNGALVSNRFYAIFNRVLTKTMADLDHPNLYLETKLDEVKTGVGLCSFLWRSYAYKDLRVNVDIVLAVEIPNWIPRLVARSSRLHRNLPSSFFVVIKPIKRLSSQRFIERNWETVLRVSVSNLEEEIMEDFPSEIRRGFILLKAIVQSPFFPECMRDTSSQNPMTSYRLKQVVYCCLDQQLANLGSTLWGCDKKTLVGTAVAETEIRTPPVAWCKAFCIAAGDISRRELDPPRNIFYPELPSHWGIPEYFCHFLDVFIKFFNDGLSV